MAIDINNNNVQQLHNAANNPLAKANAQAKDVDALNNAKTNPPPASVKTPTDSLTLTDSAINLKKLEGSIAHLPIVDMQKVEEIQNKIKDGSYSINSDKIAERFIEMEIALFK
ncbi:MAG: flagellar biosynthesis anti-sigma factor FlgM [Pseudomonadota bacterium]